MEVDQDQESDAMLQVHYEEAEFEETVWPWSVGDVIDGEEVFVVDGEDFPGTAGSAFFLSCFSLIEYSLITFLPGDTSSGGFLVDTVYQCAHRKENEVEADYNQNIDEGISVDDVFDALGGVQVTGGARCGGGDVDCELGYGSGGGYVVNSKVAVLV